MCAPLGMYETLKPFVGTVLTRKSSGNSLSQHVGVEISGSQAHLGDTEIKQKHKLLHGVMLFPRGRVALYLSLIIRYFTKKRRGVHHTPGFIAHVKGGIKNSPWPAGLLLHMRL